MASSPYTRWMRAALALPMPWEWRNTMISRTAFCSRQASVTRACRFVPMPSSASRRSGFRSMTSNTSVPKALTS